VIDAVRASAALPGLFTPALHEGRLLVDGGLVNPVSVSLCRAMGADIVIAVDLNWDLMLHRSRVAGQADEAGASDGGGLLDALLAHLRPAGRVDGDSAPAMDMPSMLDVLTSSLNIMQMRITQSRAAGEPADVVVRPRLNDVAAMDFHLGASIIAEGGRAAEFALTHIHDVLG
jgi:NTE family protein